MPSVPQYINSFPNWMVYFAFFSSLILTILAIIEIIARLTKKAKLDFRLTREVFLRLFEEGESIYANSVIIAHNSGALIENVKVTLTKKNGSIKNFILDILNVGEKYRTNEGFSQYYFHSASPLYYIPANIPQRIVYLCSHQHYSELTKIYFSDFNFKLHQLKNKYTQIYDSDDYQIIETFRNEVDSIISETCSKIMDSIQIEPGTYIFTITLSYRQRGGILPFQIIKEENSSVQFKVEENVRDIIRYQINNYLNQKAINWIFNEDSYIPTTEYSPIEIIEL